MPLDIEEFNKLSVKKTYLKLGRNQSMIAEFLKENIKSAFTQREIKVQTDIEFDAAVNTALHSLKIKGLVESKRIEGTLYWRGKYNGLLEIDISDKNGNGEKATDEKDRD